MKVRSLATTNPELLGQWHSKKNGQTKPEKVAAGSKKVVWWRCENGHEWQASVAARHRGSPCPRCTLGAASLPEQFLYHEIREVFSSAASQVHLELQGKVTELDIFVPEIRLAVEYDGIHHASKRRRDEDKNALLGRNHIQLIRVRCTGLPNIERHGSVVTVHDPDDPVAIRRCLQFIGHFVLDHYDMNERQSVRLQAWTSSPPDVQLNLTSRQLHPIPNSSSLAVLKPNVSEEWHGSWNHPLTPGDVTANSRKRVWWQCRQGHTWQATVKHRAKGAPCPYCTGKYARPEDSLARQAPHLVKEWHPDKNGEWTATNTYASSGQTVWWICSHKHEWKAPVAARLCGLETSQCPCCHPHAHAANDPVART